MSKDFPLFAAAVRENWAKMNTQQVFVVQAPTDLLYSHYLESFPLGSNPVFRERTEHDCSCCKNFIRNVAGLVILEGLEFYTIWDGMDHLPEPYNIVAAEMAYLVRQFAIHSVYLTPMTSYGNEKTVELMDGNAHVWNHFSAKMPRALVNKDFTAVMGERRTQHQTFTRGLKELTVDGLNQVLELINTKGALYRGEEHRINVKTFITLVGDYNDLNSPEARDNFVWAYLTGPRAHFRGTAIGQLCVALSAGEDIEESVGKYEAMVAPENYKRPTALVTQKMIDNALATLDELDLRPALDRRHATMGDITTNNVIWASGIAQNHMKDGLRDLLAPAAKKPEYPNLDHATEMGIEDFMTGVLPYTTDLKLGVENHHMNNFVSLIAPENQPENTSSFGLTKWNNDFTWSYDGNLADATLKDRVKKAGGRVDNAQMRFSLGWFNRDDLDIHVYTPIGTHVYFGNRQGLLDVDMNMVTGKAVTNAVENVSFMDKPADGVYQVRVANYQQRDYDHIGFDLEIASGLSSTMYSYRSRVPQNRNDSGRYGIHALNVTVKNGVIVQTDIMDKLIKKGQTVSQDKWGVSTQSLVSVSTVMFSPNYWDSQTVGNKHWFFMLEGCKNPEPTRGFYNEMISDKLNKDRKVFDLLATRMMCEPSEEQLSGLGFSSTRDASVVVVATTSKGSRPYKIVF